MATTHFYGDAERWNRLLLWLGFSVLMSLAPLGINFLLVRGEAGFNFAKTYDKGELFLIATALCADATGRLFNHKGNTKVLTTLFMIVTVFLLCWSTIECGLVARQVYLDQPISLTIGSDSLKCFLGTVCVGLGAILLEDS
ncbi:hypothetical protein [Granulicella paludicola]|uniref:hypothetical protein n=1 Tax=Granulicella paludicola TaxID=474951 RepID=UPI0021E0169E|nr:hypothetical protein [Granulicella paludicola]